MFVLGLCRNKVALQSKLLCLEVLMSGIKCLKSSDSPKLSTAA